MPAGRMTAHFGRYLHHCIRASGSAIFFGRNQKVAQQQSRHIAATSPSTQVSQSTTPPSYFLPPILILGRSKQLSYSCRWPEKHLGASTRVQKGRVHIRFWVTFLILWSSLLRTWAWM